MVYFLIFKRLFKRLNVFGFNRKYVSILYHFRVIACYLSKVANFNPPHLHLNFAVIFGTKELLGYRVALFASSYV